MRMLMSGSRRTFVGLRKLNFNLVGNFWREGGKKYNKICVLWWSTSG